MPHLLSGWKPSSPSEAYCFVDHPASPLSHSPIASSAATVRLPVTLPRRGEPGHIKRPRNGFIIFRCEFVAKNRGKMTRSKNGGPPKRLSHTAGEMWNKLSQAERDVYMTLAALEKEEHSRRYPDYVYRPNKQRTGRQPTTPKRAYRPASTIEQRRVRQLVSAPVEMPSIGSLSISEPAATFAPVSSPSYPASSPSYSSPSPSYSAPSPSYSAVESVYSPSSSRSTPFLYEAQSPATESDYPRTPHSEYATPLYATTSEDVMNTYTYSYQSMQVHLPIDHHYAESTGMYAASPSPPSYTYGPSDEPPACTTSTYSTLANWAGELDAPSAPSTSSTTYTVPVMPMAPPAEVSGYSQPSFGTEVVDFDAYVYSEPVSLVSHV